VFDFAAVAGYPLDFNTDRPHRFDTGGRNWVHLYRYLDQKDITLTAARWISMVDPQTATEVKLEMIDGFVHVGQVGHGAVTGWADETARQAFFCHLVERSEDDGTLDDLALGHDVPTPHMVQMSRR
jgi:hypothetical protein